MQVPAASVPASTRSCYDRRLVPGALLLLFFAGSSPEPAAMLARAAAYEADLEYELALDELRTALEHPAISDEQALDAHLRAGAISRIMDRNVEARAHLLYVLKRRPDLALPARYRSPRVSSFFEVIRDEARSDLDQRPAAPAAPSPAPKRAGPAPAAPGAEPEAEAEAVGPGWLWLGGGAAAAAGAVALLGAAATSAVVGVVLWQASTSPAATLGTHDGDASSLGVFDTRPAP